jgi:hypothetical protein
MRIFIEHKADVLPVVERGRIVGQLDRLSIMEALSEIRPEGYLLTLKPAESAEELLRRLDNTGSDALPTINRAFEFNALWGRTEILQAQGKIPQVKIWQPAPAAQLAATKTPQAISPRADNPIEQRTTATESSQQREDAVATLAAMQNALPNEIPSEQPTTITIVREAATTRTAPRPLEKEGALANAGVRSPAEKFHRELERGRLAINTLAVLELPLMACDGSGAELFHNRPFGELRRRFLHLLDSGELLHQAKDAIAASALRGDLDSERPVKLKSNVKGFRIFCKAIRDFDNPSARVQGYIFWLEQATPRATLTADWSTNSNSDEGRSFAGRTLPEILAAEESRAIAWAMREANGNQTDAAMLLGIPRQTFNYRYRKLLRQKAQQNSRHNRNLNPTQNPGEKD